MWCNVCQCDVATEVAADHRRVTCSTCGQVLGETATSRLETPMDATPNRAGEARALLDRWAKNHSFDPYGPEKKAATNADLARPEFSPSQPAKPDPSASVAPEERQRVPFEAAARAGSQSDEMSPASSVGPDERPSRTPSFRIDAPASPAAGMAEPRVPASRSTLQASAAELESLTNEILSRVSQISSEREQLRDQRTASVAAPSEPVIADPAATASNSTGPRLPENTPSVPTDQEWDRAGDHVEPPQANDQQAPIHQPEFERAAPMPNRASDDSARISDMADRDAPETSETGLPRTVRREALHPAPASERDPMVNLRSDQPHVGTTRPHVDLSAVEASNSKSSRGWFSGIGQGLSYLGILLMTGGTAFVISAYFGAATGNAATGWLIATVGQMLLLLGIVTLVSSGMEETAAEVSRTVNDRLQEVSRQLEQIGDRIIRVEQGNESGPRRPHFISRTDNSRQSATVGVEDEQAH
jgi:ethanolamine utilization microcompartment shell protein EutS